MPDGLVSPDHRANRRSLLNSTTNGRCGVIRGLDTSVGVAASGTVNRRRLHTFTALSREVTSQGTFG